MSLHKVSAGDGYTYLTRQVACGDNTDRAGDRLADYYGTRGESPGRWTGRLAAAIGVDGTVDEGQMLALFGEGRHPNAAIIEQAAVVGGATPAEALARTRLGRPFAVFDVDPQFPTRLARAYAAHNFTQGLRQRTPIPDAERAVIRTRVAREMFAEQYHRPPADTRELSGWVARNTRPKQVAVAGYDLTFSPVKSVSVLWALAPREVSEQVAAAHEAAVATVIDRIETEAAYTRQGAGGVRQVKVDGVIAAAFTHRSSRAGDPDLHTHVTVASKVRAPDGAWLALDGRMLYKGNVAYSEMYNTELEAELTIRLPGLAFRDVARGDGKRPVRELAGVDERLLTVLSKRAAAIEPRRAQLAAQFLRDQGRTPTRKEQLALAQQATLASRQVKKDARSLAEERAAWRAEAFTTIGEDALTASITAALTARPGRQAAPAFGVSVGAAQAATTVDRVAAAVIVTVSGQRAVFQDWHLRAEAQRQVRGLGVGELSGRSRQDMVTAVVDAALADAGVVPLVRDDATLAARVEAGPAVPGALRNPDGSSQYAVFRAGTYTTTATLEAEARIVAAAGRRDGWVADPSAVETALLESVANGRTLNTGQTQLVRDLALSGARFQLALAPAGSGKTTAMKTLARAWESSGGTVVGLAPSAAAASELAASIGQRADTVDKLVHELDHARRDPNHRVPAWIADIGPATLIVVDEVSLASTAHLDQVIGFALERGASVRGVGDPAQRGSVAAGGVMRDVETCHGAVALAEVMRFVDPTEGAASLALRTGDVAALGHYLDKGRIHVGDLDTALAAVFDAWAADRARGVDAVMMAPLRTQVATLNVRARAAHLATQAAAGVPRGREATLAGGQQASVGDLIQTRVNRRSLPLGTTDFVRNGYRFTVTAVHDDGSLTARHLSTGRQVHLPAAYLAESAELGFARTVAAAQGMTAGGQSAVDAVGETVRVDGVAHVLVDPAVMDRESFYVAMTRGTAANHAYVIAAGRGEEDAGLRPEVIAPPTAAELLAQVLERSSTSTSATSEAAASQDPAARLGRLAARYADAVRVGAAEMLGDDAVARIAADAEQVVPGVSEAPAWPTLAGHLALLELNARHHDPAAGAGAAVRALATAAASRELAGARDMAAVLDWRLTAPTTAGPLPWLPATAARLADDPGWGPFLTHLADQTAAAAGQVADRTAGWADPAGRGQAPAWARPLVAADALPVSLARLAVWRAAHRVDDADLRPTGPPVQADAERRHQLELDGVAAGYGIHYAVDAETMTPLAARVNPTLVADAYWPQLAARLRAAERAGVDVTQLVLVAAAEGGPLPDEQPAAALWWRLSRYLAPNVADTPVGEVSARPAWAHDLDALVVDQWAAEAVLTSPAWPALVARVDAAARDGADRAALLADGLTAAAAAGVTRGELATAALWHVSLLADPPPRPVERLPPDPADLERQPPADLDAVFDVAAVAGLDDRWELLESSADLATAADVEGFRLEADPFAGDDPTIPTIPADLTDGHRWTAADPGWFVPDGLAPLPPDLYRHLPPADRVAALTADLTTARRTLAERTEAFDTDRGAHLTAAADLIRELYDTADRLAPYVADRAFAHADWQAAERTLEDLEHLLADTRTGELAAGRDPAGSTHAAYLDAQLSAARELAAAARADLDAADTRLTTAAGRHAVVTHQDATQARLTAADLDLADLNTARQHIRTLQDHLLVSQSAAGRAAARTTQPPVNPAAQETGGGIDSGFQTGIDTGAVIAPFPGASPGYEAHPGFDHGPSW